jgi:hypothetical protein
MVRRPNFKGGVFRSRKPASLYPALFVEIDFSWPQSFFLTRRSWNRKGHTIKKVEDLFRIHPEPH